MFQGNQDDLNFGYVGISGWLWGISKLWLLFSFFFKRLHSVFYRAPSRSRPVAGSHSQKSLGYGSGTVIDIHHVDWEKNPGGGWREYHPSVDRKECTKGP